MTADESITVLVTSSVVPSHPSTEIVEECLASIRVHLPTADVLLLCDGVRDEQQDRRDDYDTYLARVLWKANHQWANVLPVLAPEWLHQAALVRLALPLVRTPLVLFMEADCALTPDCPIDFDGCARAILSGEVNLIRYHYESHVLEDHAHLSLDRDPILVEGVPLIRTAQFSARPHLASTAFYSDLIATAFEPDCRTFVEDVTYGMVVEAWRRYGVPGWARWRLAIYHPDGNIKRSTTCDGREGGEKYDDQLVFSYPGGRVPAGAPTPMDRR